jgi:glycosyltransferase involved in cell wall biosynthesis
LHEGFGLPVIEGMARGVPVACSDRSSLPEVAGGAAALFDPTDARAVAATLERVLGDGRLRAELIARGRARAAALGWEATARGTLDCYRRVLG